MTHNKNFKNNSQKELIQNFMVIYDMGKTRDALRKLRERELRKFGLTPEQCGALICIHSLNNNTTPTEISKWLFRKANSMTILLRRMQNMGLIDWKRDPIKKSQTRVSLTKKGYEAYEHAIEFNSVDFIAQILKEKELKQLLSLLFIIRKQAFINLGLDVNNYDINRLSLVKD